ncbi:hypothetical protein ACOSP7_006576 [Xanthoceras sorbifolium]
MVKLKANQPVEVDLNLHGQTIDAKKKKISCVQVEDAVSSHACTPSHVFTTQSQHGSVSITQDMSQFENARCHLLHWYPNDDYEDQIVAEGMISSTNPKDKVHTMPLGRGYWRVWVDAVFHDIKVCRSTDEYETLS